MRIIQKLEKTNINLQQHCYRQYAQYRKVTNKKTDYSLKCSKRWQQLRSTLKTQRRR